MDTFFNLMQILSIYPSGLKCLDNMHPMMSYCFVLFIYIFDLSNESGQYFIY